MALGECKECGREVSTKADTCPHCGVKEPTTPTWLRVVSVIGVLLFFGWMCSSLIPNDSADSNQRNKMSVRDSIENARQDSLKLETLKKEFNLQSMQ